MIWYRLLFLNRKTFTAAAVGAFALMIAGMSLMAAIHELTIFTAVCYLLTLILCAGLTVAWKNGDIIRISGLVGGILLVVLCRYTYLSEQYISIGVDAIVALGMVECMIFSAYLMVAFIILMVTYNHFTIQIGKNSGRTKLVVNQVSICALLLCFLILTVERWLISNGLLEQIAGALNCVSDLCLFVMIACSELFLTVDGQMLTACRGEK